MEIRLISLHHIDNDGNYSSNGIINDGRKYVEELIKNIASAKDSRQYEIISASTEVVGLIVNLCTLYIEIEEAAITTEKDEKIAEYKPIEIIYEKIAKRLVKAQEDTRKARPALRPPKKGNLIQVLAETEDEFLVVISLIDSKRFIDDNDLKYRSGMLEGNETSNKSAKFYINKKTLEFNKIILSGKSNQGISNYWYDKFLELNETRSDIKNTTTAYAALKSSLDVFKKKFPVDGMDLKNTLGVYFSHSKSFNFEECVSYLLDNYEQKDTGWDKERFKNDLLSCNKNGIFDNTFNIDNKDIAKYLNNLKVVVNSNMEIKIKKPLETMENSIYTARLNNGEKVLIIKNVNEKTLETFNYNNEDLN